MQLTGELAVIEAIRRQAQAGAGRARGLRLGIGDDCAILRPGSGEEIVVTTDFSLEGRHFRRDWHNPESVGHRTLARGLSDLAAMGARPMAAFLSLALPRSVAAQPLWLSGFLQGLLTLAEKCKVPLAGGDTAESPSEHVLADIVLLGAVPRGKALRRDGARAGDRLFVTGDLGGSAAELDALQTAGSEAGVSDFLPSEDHPHLFPEPRLKTGRELVRRGLATAAMDLSDGLSSDLAKLCDASAVGAEVFAAHLPVHSVALASAGESDRALHWALHGGEDYELLFTVPGSSNVPRRLGGVHLTEIGKIVERRRGRPQVVLVDPSGRRAPLKPEGWEHLR